MSERKYASNSSRTAPMLSGSEIAERAHPLDAIAGRQRYFLRHLALSLTHGAREVALSDAEFDRDIALLVFAIDHRGPRAQGDAGDLAQRDLDGAASARIGDAQNEIADRVDAPTILRSEANDDW